MTLVKPYGTEARALHHGDVIIFTCLLCDTATRLRIRNLGVENNLEIVFNIVVYEIKKGVF